MGRLFLVRHAQASFLSQNYDQLSTLGETQSRLLGEFWARRKMPFDHVYTGPALRHLRTAQIVADAYRKIGFAFPEPVTLAEFHEFQGEALLSGSLPQLLAQDKVVRDLHEAVQASGNEIEKRTAFQRLFEAVVSRWVNGEITPPNVEPWLDFCARVNRGLQGLLPDSGKGANLAVFTSGGPIGVAVQHALHLSPQDTLQILWMSRNCSWSEFLFSRDRFTLSSFNSYPHLNDDSLLTYR